MEHNEILLPEDMMIVSETDAKGYILFANADFCKISGYSLQELMGKPHNQVRHKDMPKVAFADMWNTIQQGNIWKGIVKNKTKDGKFYWVNATAFPCKKDDGTVRYISIRIKPTQEEIYNAEELYKTLN